MDPARLLRFRGARLRSRDANVLRARTALGERRAGGDVVDHRLRLVDHLRGSLDSLLVLLLAPVCVACGDLLAAPLEGPICSGCWRTVRVLTPPLCATCGEPLAVWRVTDQAYARCARCRRAPRFLSRARSAGSYEGTLRAAIHALKYGGRRSLACRLAELMRASGVDVLSGADAVVPVPLHRARQLARGFNQSADLARHLSLPIIPALTRTRNTAPQADLPAGRRHANVRAAFAAKRVEAWHGATLVLVDDVTTTGATLEACARTLVEAGAAEVRAITAARAVRLQR